MATPSTQKAGARSIGASVTQKELDRAFSNESFDWIGWRLEQQEYISGEELAAAIASNPDTALPGQIRNYLCRFLRGKVKKKRGPKTEFSFVREAILISAALAYENELHRLQAEHKNRSRFRGQAAPHELAAQSVQKQFKLFESITPRRLANILSSRNSGVKSRE